LVGGGGGGVAGSSLWQIGNELFFVTGMSKAFVKWCMIESANMSQSTVP
jgi:hypothetical protein